jgi:hypothetical protein
MDVLQPINKFLLVSDICRRSELNILSRPEEGSHDRSSDNMSDSHVGRLSSLDWGRVGPRWWVPLWAPRDQWCGMYMQTGMGGDSAVGIATRSLLAGRPMDRGSSPGKDVMCPNSSRPALGIIQPSSQWLPGNNFPDHDTDR